MTAITRRFLISCAVLLLTAYAFAVTLFGTADNPAPEPDGVNHLPFPFVDATEGTVLTEMEPIPLEISGDTEYIGLELCGYDWWCGPYMKVRISNLRPDEMLEVRLDTIEYLTDGVWVETNYSSLYQRIVSSVFGNTLKPPRPTSGDRIWSDFPIEGGKSYNHILDIPYTIPGTYRVTWTYWYGFRYSDPPHDLYSFSAMIEVPDMPDRYRDSQCLVFANIARNVYPQYNSQSNGREGQDENRTLDRSDALMMLAFPDGSGEYRPIEDSFRLEEIYPDGSSRPVSEETGEASYYIDPMLGIVSIHGEKYKILSLSPVDSYVPYLCDIGIVFNEAQEEGRTYSCTVDFTDNPAQNIPSFTVSFKIRF